MNESELQRLLRTKGGCRVPKMPPIPDVKAIEKLPFIPLPPYNRIKEKQARYRKMLKDEAKEKKGKFIPPLSLLCEEQESVEEPQEQYINVLRECARKVKPPPMIKTWEKQILGLVPSAQLTAHATLVNTIIDESKLEWDRSLQELTVKTVIRDEPGVPRKKYQESLYKHKGITDNYEQMVKFRKKLESGSLIFHPFIRLILESSEKNFPEKIINLSDYREKGPITLQEFYTKVVDQIKRADYLVSSTWYSILVNWLKTPNCLKDIRQKKINDFVKCSTKMISMQIQQLMRRSIDAVIDDLKNPDATPVLNIDLDFDGEFQYDPLLEDVFATFHNIVDAISHIAQRLIPIEEYLKLPYDVDILPVNYNEWLSQDGHSRLQQQLDIVFAPLLEYTARLREKYNMLYGVTPEKYQSIQQEGDFDVSRTKILYLENVARDVTASLENEYFICAVVCQLRMIAGLKGQASKLIETVITGIVKTHKEENENICQEFEFIAKKALKKPETATELVEQGIYMAQIKNEQLELLNHRLSKQIVIAADLIELTNLSDDHIASNTRAIKWHHKILPILAQNAAAYEQHKAEMEENLLGKIAVLSEEISNLTPYLEQLDYMDNVNKTLEYLEYLRKLLHRLHACDELVVWINNEEAIFKFPLTVYSDLEDLKDFIIPFHSLVYLVHRWKRSYYTWMDGPFEYLDHNKIEENHDFYYNEFINLTKYYKNKIRQQITEGIEKRFAGLVDDLDINNQPAPMKLCAHVLAELKQWQPNVQMAHIMCNPALRQRHWDEMSLLAGLDLTPDAGTTLRKIINHNLWENIDEYQIISVAATKELGLITNLDLMKAEWTDIYFETCPYIDTNIKILSVPDDVLCLLDEQFIKTIAMRESAFVKPFEVEVRAWHEKIYRVNATIDEWCQVQSQWLYLLPIFSSKHILDQMPAEGAMFTDVNIIYRQYMSAIENDPHVLRTTGTFGVLEQFKICADLLEKINDGVNNYLEKKRLYFPRFFFLSNDEMLEILSETENPLKVQPHLKKCFEGVDKLAFNPNFFVSGMISVEGEQVEFLENIDVQAAQGSVEKWLVQVEEQMLGAIKSETELSYNEYPTLSRPDWILSWEGMVVLAVSQIYWAIDVHECLTTHKLSKLEAFHESLTKQLHETVAIIRRTDLNKLSNITVKALIVIDIHAKDVIQYLIEKSVSDVTDFQWLMQLRYYWEDEKVSVKIINAVVKYAYEYLGNSDRLVITPLTDRCYRSLIGAYYLHLNGAPEGPAGTGKTETMKDLAKALAVQCVIFNCSEGLNYKTMGNFFKGLASCGAWVCFDDFNRIDVKVLSVIAQQILCIVQALRQKLKIFAFEGTTLTLNPACYVCITMNPDYAGRSELPDNLKVLFRTVAMMVPDYAMISEISLHSFGFNDARSLSTKIMTINRLCSDQLSSQNHYDYGMRTLKAVLLSVGNLKRVFPSEDESTLFVNSIKNVILPKLLSFDVPLFELILSDLFPGITLSKRGYGHLVEACKNSCKNNNLQPEDYFLNKVIQIYEMMFVRHGFMLVGDPFSGKSMRLKVLAEALSLMHQRDQPNGCECTYKIINPKAVTMRQLYGAYDLVSNEWTDGIVAVIFREFASDDTPNRKWIVFDGPVDTVWIENMNTVLDDNRKLCLMSGEIISMTNVMSMIFEVMDLSQASPATVSRCGFIYMEAATCGSNPFLKSWVNTLNPTWAEDNEEYIYNVCKWLFDPSIAYIRKYCSQLVTAGDVNLLMSTFKLVDMLMDDAINGEEDNKYMRTWFIASLMVGLIWGIGGILDTDSRVKFDDLIKDYLRGDRGIPENIDKIDVSIPPEGLISDHYYMYKGKGCWKTWPDAVKVAPVREHINLLQTVVPTLETEIFTLLLNLHVKYANPLLLIGPTGTGKSFYTQSYLMNNVDMEKYSPGFITFTTSTSCNEAQNFVISKLVKRKKNNYGPLKGKLAVIFIDDMNMPTKELYGAQPAIELLRLYFDHKYWYDLKTNDKLFIHDTLFIGAIGSVRGNRHVINTRLLRHYSIYAVNEISKDSMSRIFTTLLQLGWRRNGFGQDVQPTISNIITSTMEIYNCSNEGLKPTPMKAHYIFNLRDICRCVQGCALLRKESAENKKTFVRLWVHEIMRVFYDRLVDDEDRTWFYNILKNITKDFMKDTFESALDTYQDDSGNVTQETIKKMMFGSYLDTETLEGEKRYEELPSKEALQELGETMLTEYNSKHKAKLNIVLFDYALEHLSKICRVLSMSMGNALLVGVGGSGRQSLTRLAATILGQSIFQPIITDSYSTKDWTDYIKNILRESGGLNKDSTFLFNERQIKEELFVQNIVSLLNTGEIPNLYNLDEKQEILSLVRLAAQGGNRNLDISPLQIMDFFIARCKNKLHICLCFSPLGNFFKSRVKLYPTLVSCCVIDWFDNWPEEALEMVANRFMTNVHMHNSVKVSVVLACKYFHDDAKNISLRFFTDYGRKTYVTSASYLNLIKTFTTLTNTKQRELNAAKAKYLNGLHKLEQAAEAVAVMQHDLNQLKPQLYTMTEKSAKMTQEIEYETEIADKAAAQVREDQKIANLQAAAAQELKKDCEADLALALPILEDAISALNTLKPADITIVKSMKNPPATVKLVMAGVCVIKGVPPDKIPDPNNPGKKTLDYWGPSKRILGDMQFLDSLRNFDKDNIPTEVMKKVRKEYLIHKDFKPHIIAKASAAAEGLCKWIIAMDMYDAVAKVVAPKKAKLEAAETEFAATMAVLDEKKATVARLEARLAELNEALKEANTKKKALEDEVYLCIDKLQRAEKLIDGLGGEKLRWNNVAENLQKLFDNLPGDILVSCGIIAYLAPFTHTIRMESVAKWQDLVVTLQIPHSGIFVFKDILGADVRIQEWCIAGLPRDAFSIDNAIILKNSLKWPLLLDPQGQANKWIKNIEKINNLQVLKFSDSDYIKVIETCLVTGKPVLIQYILDDLEPPLELILQKNIFKEAEKEFIALGEFFLEYHQNFRLYMTTKLRQPHYSPEIFNNVTLINFVLPKDGLEEQLLEIVVTKENPNLQEMREELIIQSTANRAALIQVENDILRTLQETQGDILENEAAVETLDSSRSLADEITKKQEASQETKIIIDQFRHGYKPIAIHAAILYDCVTDLPNVDPMYQFSLTWFINLFVLSIANANKSKVLDKRLTFLKETFTYNVYHNVCRSLFDIDKLMFSFVMCTKLMLAYNEIAREDYLFLISSNAVIENALEKPVDWLPDTCWDDICRLSELEAYTEFKYDFRHHLVEWKLIYDDLDPHKKPLPGIWNINLSNFQKILVVKVLRPDKLPLAISDFIEKAMGKKYVALPPFNIAKFYADSNCLTPLIFILSPGSDPLEILMNYCEKMGILHKFHYISLGQGQGPIAKAVIERAQQNGDWVCLQNCHLAVSWLPTLENIIEGFNLPKTDLSFRLWLTSYSSEKFPEAVLQNGIKMIIEDPIGLRNNLKRAYFSNLLREPEFFEGCPGKDKAFSKLLYGICFFHAVVQERKKFGPLGWNIQYDFNDTDFQISVKQLQMFVNQYEDIPYLAVNYLAGECNYGGRVTDDWDRRLIVTILNNFVNPSVVHDPNYLFSDLGPQYGLPRRCEYRDYLKFIESVTVNPPPEVFGLHMNAGITRGNRVAMELMNSLVLVEGTYSEVKCENTEMILDQMASELISKLPQPFNIETVLEKYPLHEYESINTVLVKEMDRFNRLLCEINSSLIDIQKAVRGIIVMSHELESQANAMLLGHIPANWTRFSYPSLKPLASYIEDLVKRLAMFNDWYENGKPSTFWLSGFFFTHTFLTGAIQDYARTQQIPMDQLVFDFEVRKVDYENNPPERGVYVHGVFMDGGRWDRDFLAVAEQFPKVFYDSMPVIWLFPVLKENFKESARYKCPLYKTLERKGVVATNGQSNNFLLAFYLPSNKPSAHWIVRSVALVLQLAN